MQAKGFLNYRLKHCWPKLSTVYVNQTNWKLRKNWGETQNRGARSTQVPS